MGFLAPPFGARNHPSLRSPAGPSDRYFDLKSKVHRNLLISLNSETLRLISKERLRGEIGSAVEQLLLQERIPMTLAERDRVIEEILDEVFGLGPLEPLLKDPAVSDILVNNHHQVYVERNGLLHRTSVEFRDDKHLLHIIEKMVAAVGRRIDEANPIVDARLTDGSRRIASIGEVVGVEAEGVLIQEIFRFERTGVNEARRIIGLFQASGYRPHFLERVHACGIHLPEEVFREQVEVR